MQGRDRAPAPGVGEFLADHRHRDTEFGRKKYLRQALKEREANPTPREIAVNKVSVV